MWKPNGDFTSTNLWKNKVKFTVLATGFGIKDVPGMDNMLNKRTIEEQKETGRTRRRRTAQG